MKNFTTKIIWVSPIHDITMTCTELSNHNVRVEFILNSDFYPEPSRTFGTWKEALSFANTKAMLYGLEREKVI
jgi:hypothetical protein